MTNPIPADTHEQCNHYHELTDKQEVVDFGSGEFVADAQRIPLLKALNDCGLITRTHCYGHESDHSFVGILMDNIDGIEVRNVRTERSGRKFENKQELIISWKRTD